MNPTPTRQLESLIAVALGAAVARPASAPATRRRSAPRPVIAHIRREDECEITYCDRLTAPAQDPAAIAPLAMATGTGVAVYADVQPPSATTTCPRCATRYADAP